MYKEQVVVLTHMFPVVNAMVKETINDRTAAMGVGWGQCEQWSSTVSVVALGTRLDFAFSGRRD